MREAILTALVILFSVASYMAVTSGFDSVQAARLAVLTGDKYGSMTDSVYGLYWVEYDCPILARFIPDQEKHHACPPKIAYFRTSNQKAAVAKSKSLSKKPGFLMLRESSASEIEIKEGL
jgi:hypothetical protein